MDNKVLEEFRIARYGWNLGISKRKNLTRVFICAQDLDSRRTGVTEGQLKKGREIIKTNVFQG